MKKLLVGVILGLALVCTGCENETQDGKEYYNDKMIVIENSNNYIIVYDKETKVKYYIRCSNYRGGITPLYNADGTLQLYEGE